MVAIAVTAQISLDINMALVTAGISLDDLVVTVEGISFAGFNLTTGIIAFAAAEAVIMLAALALGQRQNHWVEQGAAAAWILGRKAIWKPPVLDPDPISK
jgi:hypothetical protein